LFIVVWKVTKQRHAMVLALFMRVDDVGLDRQHTPRGQTGH
jgi:hypothetical protein